MRFAATHVHKSIVSIGCSEKELFNHRFFPEPPLPARDVSTLCPRKSHLKLLFVEPLMSNTIVKDHQIIPNKCPWRFQFVPALHRRWGDYDWFVWLFILYTSFSCHLFPTGRPIIADLLNHCFSLISWPFSFIVSLKPIIWSPRAYVRTPQRTLHTASTLVKIWFRFSCCLMIPIQGYSEMLF